MLVATEHIWPVRNNEELRKFEEESRDIHQRVDRAVYIRSFGGDLDYVEPHPYTDREGFIRWLGNRRQQAWVRLKIQHHEGREARAEFTETGGSPEWLAEDPNRSGVLGIYTHEFNGTYEIVEHDNGTIHTDNRGIPGEKRVNTRGHAGCELFEEKRSLAIPW